MFSLDTLASVFRIVQAIHDENLAQGVSRRDGRLKHSFKAGTEKAELTSMMK